MRVLEIFVIIAIVTGVSQTKHTRIKRMYGLCPPDFHRIGSACYFISKEKMNWLDAHFECKDRNSKLAEPIKVTDRQLRKHLNSADNDKDEIWIGGSYEWNEHKWVWGYSGHDMKYQSFSRMDPSRKDSLQHHCAVLSPELKYRWSARPCVDPHRFICQHKMLKTSARNRAKIYTRWNGTYPNQQANEVLLQVNLGAPRTHRRLNPESQVEAFSSSANMTRSGHKRFNWPANSNYHNNTTIPKPPRKTSFDKIAERKRQKEMRRRKRIQQMKKQKHLRIKSDPPLSPVFFPPPVTEILMFPNIKDNNEVTTSRPIINFRSPDKNEYYPVAEKEQAESKQTLGSEQKPEGDDKMRKDSSVNEDKQKQKESESNVSTGLNLNINTSNYSQYFNKLEEFEKQEHERIDNEQQKREKLKILREEEIKRLSKFNEKQKEEEQRIADEFLKNQMDAERQLKENERLQKEKIQEEEKQKQALLEKQAVRMEALRKYKEKLRKEKEEKLRLALSSKENLSNSENETNTSDWTNSKNDETTNEEKKLRLQKLRERLEKLTPEQRQRFHELRMQRKKQKLKRSRNTAKRSASIPQSA